MVTRLIQFVQTMSGLSADAGFPGSTNWAAKACDKQGWRDSNPQPLVLETRALPIELHPFEEGNSR